MTQREPPAFTNMECVPPAEMATTLFVTYPGVEVGGIPNCPYTLDPIPQRVPSFFRNREWFTPAEMATTLLATVMGRLVLPVVPLPSWPFEFLPIPHNAPSRVRNRE